MFDFLRNLTKSAEEKRQERLHAYLDNALAPQERQQFEQELAQDAALKGEMADLWQLKQQLRGLPRRPVPHNFTLDPAVYGRPARQPLFQFYPVLQGATVLTALFFILALSLSLFQPRTETGAVASAPQMTMAEQGAGATEAPAANVLAEASDEADTVTQADAEVSGEPMVEVVAETAEVAAEEAAVEEETLEDEEAGAEAAEGAAGGETLPEATAVPPPAVDAPESATVTPTIMLLAPTIAAIPTPTVSELPRPATQTADTRSLDLQATITAGDNEDSTTDDSLEQTVQPSPTPIPTPILTINPLRLAQIGLGILFIIFSVLTFYVRRNS